MSWLKVYFQNVMEQENNKNREKTLFINVMYNIDFTVSIQIIKWIKYVVHCILYIVNCTMYNVQCTVYIDEPSFRVEHMPSISCE